MRVMSNGAMPKLVHLLLLPINFYSGVRSSELVLSPNSASVPALYRFVDRGKDDCLRVPEEALPKFITLEKSGISSEKPALESWYNTKFHGAPVYVAAAVLHPAILWRWIEKNSELIRKARTVFSVLVLECDMEEVDDFGGTHCNIARRQDKTRSRICRLACRVHGSV